MRELRKGWEKELRALQRKADTSAAPILKEWIKLTNSYWPGLFHCYIDTRIPQTNNEMERFIKELKTLERRLSRMPKPALRFTRNAPVNATFANRRVLPGAEELARHSREDLERAKEAMRSNTKKLGVYRLARRNIDKALSRVLQLWSRGGQGPPSPKP